MCRLFACDCVIFSVLFLRRYRHAVPAAQLTLTVCVSVILGKSHYLLFCLTPALQPRMLVTFDEELKPLPVSVRVGQVSGGPTDELRRHSRPHNVTRRDICRATWRNPVIPASPNPAIAILHQV